MPLTSITVPSDPEHQPPRSSGEESSIPSDDSAPNIIRHGILTDAVADRRGLREQEASDDGVVSTDTRELSATQPSTAWPSKRVRPSGPREPRRPNQPLRHKGSGRLLPNQSSSDNEPVEGEAVRMPRERKASSSTQRALVSLFFF